jgi:hypothetical protein
MLLHVWQEAQFQLAICRVTNEAHVENGLRYTLKLNAYFLNMFIIFLNICSRNPTIIFQSAFITFAEGDATYKNQ